MLQSRYDIIMERFENLWNAENETSMHDTFKICNPPKYYYHVVRYDFR